MFGSVCLCFVNIGTDLWDVRVFGICLVVFVYALSISGQTYYICLCFVNTGTDLWDVRVFASVW